MQLFGYLIHRCLIESSLFLASDRARFEQRNDGHLRHQHQSFVGDADLGDHRERDQVEAHIGNGAAGGAPFHLQGFDLFCHLADALVGEEARDRQRHHRGDLAVRHHADAALLVRDRPQRDLHVVLVGAGDDDVVGIVSDAARDRPAREAEILEQPMRDIAGRASVAFHYRDEAEAVRGEQRGPVVGGCERHPVMEQGDAGQRRPDCVGDAGCRGKLRNELGRGRHLDRRVRGLGILITLRESGIERRRDGAVLDHELAAIPGVADLEGVVHQHQVGAPAATQPADLAIEAEAGGAM